MLIGYRVDRAEIEYCAAVKLGLIQEGSTDFFDPNECQGMIEGLGKEIGVRQEMLGFDEIAYVVDDLKSTSVRDVRRQLRSHTKKLKELAKILTDFGIDTSIDDAELLVDPEWTRHGVCLNYD